MEYSANPTSNSSLLSLGGKQYFPNSTIVMDMVLISHAVYKLKNRVSSCTDARAWDVNVIQSFLREEYDEKVNNSQSNLKNDDYYFNRRSYYLNNDNNDEEPKDLYQLLLPPGVTCLYYSHDPYLGTQVLVVRSTQHHYITVAYAGTDDWRTALMDGNIMMSNIGPTPDSRGSSTNKISDNTTNNKKSMNENDSSGGRQQKQKQKKEQLQSLFNTIPNEIYVHRGFNEAVFDASHLVSVLTCVEVARLGGDCTNIDNSFHDDTDNNSNNRNNNDSNNIVEGWDNWWPWWKHTAPPSPPTPIPPTTPMVPYELYTTGHSLGAANSVLLGLALHMLYPTDNVRSINYGCPKIGNIHWSYYVNSLQPDQPTNLNKPQGGTYEVFRFVNKIDLVPRLPELGVAMNPILSHTGHTLQMSVGGSIHAYYDHYGNEDDGYLGVPFGWEAASYALMPLAIASHPCSHYVEYLNDYKPSNSTLSSSDDNNSLYYVNEFELMDGYVAPPILLIDNNSSIDGDTIFFSETQR